MIYKKVECIYNKNFFEKLYNHMLKHQLDTKLDESNTAWHLMDVEDILIKEYGYRRVSGGSLL